MGLSLAAFTLIIIYKFKRVSDRAKRPRSKGNLGLEDFTPKDPDAKNRFSPTKNPLRLRGRGPTGPARGRVRWDSFCRAVKIPRRERFLPISANQSFPNPLTMRVWE